jgi:hypothetical protein
MGFPRDWRQEPLWQLQSYRVYRMIKVQHTSLLLTILGLRIRNLNTSLFLPNLYSAQN